MKTQTGMLTSVFLQEAMVLERRNVAVGTEEKKQVS